jgi:hypothetical protein
MSFSGSKQFVRIGLVTVPLDNILSAFAKPEGSGEFQVFLVVGGKNDGKVTHKHMLTTPSFEIATAALEAVTDLLNDRIHPARATAKIDELWAQYLASVQVSAPRNITHHEQPSRNTAVSSGAPRRGEPLDLGQSEGAEY